AAKGAPLIRPTAPEWLREPAQLPRDLLERIFRPQRMTRRRFLSRTSSAAAGTLALPYLIGLADFVNPRRARASGDPYSGQPTKPAHTPPSTQPSRQPPGGSTGRPAAGLSKPLDVTVSRELQTGSLTNGYIAVDGRVVAYTREPPALGNINDISSIPEGTYDGHIRQDGPKGWRIELENVPGREHVQIHLGGAG